AERAPLRNAPVIGTGEIHSGSRHTLSDRRPAIHGKRRRVDDRVGKPLARVFPLLDALSDFLGRQLEPDIRGRRAVPLAIPHERPARQNAPVVAEEVVPNNGPPPYREWPCRPPIRSAEPQP